MAYFVKTRQLQTAGGSVVVPTGPTVLRPTSPVNGAIRFNTDTSRFEIYYTSWRQMAILGNVNIIKDTFTGDGSTIAYVLSAAPSSEEGIQVFIGNVHQNASVAYTISSSTIIFATAPPISQTIEVYQGFDSTDAH
jgi:hypothetical protein